MVGGISVHRGGHLAISVVTVQNFHDRWRLRFAVRPRTWADCSTERNTTNPNASPERRTRFGN